MQLSLLEFIYSTPCIIYTLGNKLTITGKLKTKTYIHLGLSIFIHISIYSNIQIYILQYNHDGIQKKVMRLIRICFPLNIKVHSLKL